MTILKQLAAAVSTVLITSFSLAQETLVTGRVYDIAEQDALEEIVAKAEATDWQKAMSKPQSEWSAYRFAPVIAAPEARTREHVPYHTVEHPVVGTNGELIYPVGYQFNPLDYMTLPRRVVVILPEHGEWASKNVQKTDLVLVAGSNIDGVSKTLDRAVFILDRRTQQRLGIEYAPSVVEQQASAFVINEYLVEPDNAIE